LVRHSSSDAADPGAKPTRCAKPAHSGVRRMGGVLCGLLLSFTSGLLQGCYVYTPVMGHPAPTSYVALDITDRGRVGLGDLIGPAATRVEGVVKAETDSTYALSVASVGYVNGQSNRWNGEPLMVRKDFIGNLRERKFSRGRTALAAGSALGGVLVFALTRGLFGFGSTGSDGKEGPAEQ
jgi:hypothetical protein